MVGDNVWTWIGSPGLAYIIGLHALGTLCPVISVVLIWRRRELAAGASLCLAAGAWLYWHGANVATEFELATAGLILRQSVPVSLAWQIRDSSRIVLSCLTLAVVGFTAMRRVQSATSAQS
jgi:hypothetical protein